MTAGPGSAEGSGPGTPGNPGSPRRTGVFGNDRARAATAKQIFGVALELKPAERSAYLAEACAGDVELRSKLERMLDKHEGEPQFLGSPTADVAGGRLGLAASDAPTAGMTVGGGSGVGSGGVTGMTGNVGPRVGRPPREGPGTRIGPFKLLQQIGEGGFGSVFMADQEHPVRRRVALKIIKLGMDTGQVVARFEQERQALAVMDHPNIAKVLDAGATETGRPYFVMELVRGVPITEYCDKNSLSIDERLELFTQVCHAVQHAHTKGVIHRDIKPSNILVSSHDGRAFAKVIDFGIAKATQQRLIEKTVFTEFSQLIGTPEYMSPEQAEGDMDIDTRSDVYSLGVLLYELLTGSTPFDSRQLRSAAFVEMQRIIREVDPPRPSTRLSQQNQTLAAIAAQRRIEPARLGVLLRGDLDWIVMRALEKDRARRYETPGALALDLSRYMAGEPVDAAPPSTVYRIRKFAKKNRGLVSAVVVIVFALTLGVVFATLSYFNAVESRNEATAAQTAERHLRAQAEEANRLLRSQRDVAADAFRRIGEQRPGFLDEFRQSWGRLPANASFQGAAADERELRMLSDMSVNLVEAERARARELEEQKIAAERARAAEEASRRRAEHVAKFLEDILTAADPRYKGGNREVTVREVLDRAGEKLDGGKLRDEPVSEIEARAVLAKTYTAFGSFDQADALLVRAQELADAAPDAPPATLANLITVRSLLRLEQGRLDEAISDSRRALALYRSAYGVDNIQSIVALRSLGLMLMRVDQMDEAHTLLEEARALIEPRAEEYPTHFAEILNSQANIAAAQSREDDGIELLTRAIQIARDTHDDADLMYQVNDLALMLVKVDRAAEAEPYFKEAFDLAIRQLGEDNPQLSVLRSNYTSLLIAMGRNEEAADILADAIVQCKAQFGPTNSLVAGILHQQGIALDRMSRVDEAEASYREAIEIRQAAGLDDHIDQASSCASLSLNLWRYKTPEKYRESEALLRKTLEIRQNKMAKDDPLIGVTQVFLGSCLYRQQRYAEAEPLLIEGFEGQRRVPGVPTVGLINTVNAIIRTYERWEETDPDKGHLAKAEPWKQKVAELQAQGAEKK